MNSPTKKKTGKKAIAVGGVLILLVVIVLAVVLFRGGSSAGNDPAAGSADIKSAAVTTGSIATTVSGSGTLTSAESQCVTVPEGVEIEYVEVDVGDQVKVGDLLAVADRNSVLTALAEAQTQLDTLDDELKEQEDDTVPSSVKAGVPGRVKAIWAEKGDSVSAVTAERGGLVLLSLDGTMGVDLPASDLVCLDDAVTVTLSNGETEEGTVVSKSERGITVTLTDNGTVLGDTVAVATLDGAGLGTGVLYVHSPLVITGYTGTVSSVKVEENQKVSASTTLMKLKDLGHTAEYEALLAQRQELAGRIQALTALYQDNRITSPFDGTVQTVEVDSATPAQTDRSSYPTGSSATPGEIALLTADLTEALMQEETDPQQPTDPETPTLPENPEEPSEPEQPEEPEVPEEPEPPEQIVPAVLTLEAQVQLEGGQLADVAKPFTLCLSGEGLTQQKTNDSTGKVCFDDLIFDREGSYVYRLYQLVGSDPQMTYDTTLYTLTVNVTQENGALIAAVIPEQQLVFINRMTTQQEPQTPEQNPEIGGGSSPNLPTIGSTGGGTSFSGVTSGSGTSTASAAGNGNTRYSDVTVLTISPDDAMTVCVSVDELDILSIQKGQEALVTIDALRTQPVTGTVTGIDTTGFSADGVTKYTVEITVEKTEQMLANMNASIEITVDQADSCLMIPEAALSQNGNSVFVYTSFDEETGTLGGVTEVVTGVSDGANVEIVSGLNENDTVYYSYSEAAQAASGPNT